MKVLALLTIVFASLTSQASVQEVGTFIPSECGSASIQQNEGELSVAAPSVSESALASQTVAVERVCVGRLVGDQQQTPITTVSFSYSNGLEKSFRVVSTANPLIAYVDGSRHSKFFLQSADGESTVMHVVRRQGAISQVSGIAFENSYSVSNFEPVLTIQ